MTAIARARPEWSDLLDLAVEQGGYFSTAQAARLGFSPELLIHHVRHQRFERARRGIYRVRHLPPADDEQLVQLWLWSGQDGIFSHRTALSLHELSDLLPARVDLTVPRAWRSRRLRIPADADLHFGDLEAQDRTWIDHVPVTTAARAIRDCRALHVPLDVLDQAIEQGLRRGLFVAEEVAG